MPVRPAIYSSERVCVIYVRISVRGFFWHRQQSWISALKKIACYFDKGNKEIIF